MKKILMLFVIFTFLVGVSMAEEAIDGVKLGSEGVEWKFTPEVETRLGYNIDSQGYGLQGRVKTDISASFYDKDTEFTGEGFIYGKIQIKDLEIEVDQSYEAYGNAYGGDRSVTGVLNVNWEDVTAWVYIGPAYIKMGNLNNEEVNYLETIADSDFSVVGYSVIPPYFTGNRGGLKVDSNNGGYLFGGSETQSEHINNNIVNPFSLANIYDRLNVLVVGFALPDVFTVELGAETYFDYTETHRGTDNNQANQTVTFNPFSVSAMADIIAIENVGIKVKANFANGNGRYITNNGASVTAITTTVYEQVNVDQGLLFGFSSENNPITIGAQADYTYKLTDMFNLVPVIGGEVQLEEKRKVDSFHISFPIATSAYTLRNTERQLTFPFEIALGARLDWKSLGLSSNEDDHLSAANIDIKVTDGISLVGLFGGVPVKHVAGAGTMYYVGTQLSIWESEATGKPGLVKGLKLGLTTNANFSLGGVYNITDLVNPDFETLAANDFNISTAKFNDVEYTVTSRLDWGIVLEASYPVAKDMVTPYAGVIAKIFDITNNEDRLFFELKDGERTVLNSGVGEDRYIDKVDLRLKFGTDVKLSKHVTLNGEWKSGNLFNGTWSLEDYFLENSNIYNTETFTGTDYFENNVSSTDNSPSRSDARLGVVSVGLKVAF